MLISVIVPCRNEKNYIKEFIHSVLNQELSPENEIEIIIADGQSDDGTFEIIQSLISVHSEIKLIENSKKKTAAGLNKCIELAKGEVIVRMDVHAEYSSNYINECVKTLKEQSADNVGGPVDVKYKTRTQQLIGMVFQSPIAVGGSRFHDIDYSGYVDTVTFGCWWKESFDQFGLFDEELERNQDDEHNLRISKGGGKIYQSHLIKSWYYPRSSIRDLWNQYMQYGYWKVRVIQKHKIPASIRHLVPGSFVLFLLVAGPLSFFNLYIQWLFIITLGLYLSIISIESVRLIIRNRASLFNLPNMPIIFFAYQISYGLGFLMGVFDFLILKSRKSGRLKNLTR